MTENKYPIGGYAPGNYQCTCCTCKKRFIGDKRAVQCEPCAMKADEEWQALSEEQREEITKRNIEQYNQLINEFSAKLNPANLANEVLKEGGGMTAEEFLKSKLHPDMLWDDNTKLDNVPIAIVGSIMDEYAAQSSRLAGGEMWIRASEFNFKDREIYFGRRTFYDDLLHRVKIVRGSGRLADGAFFWQGLNEPPVMERHFEELEILCEDQPPVSVLIETLDKAIQEINNALNQYK